MATNDTTSNPPTARQIEYLGGDQWEYREWRDLNRQLAELDAQPLRDRQAARADWAASMADDLELVRERAIWLFQGGYGWAAMQRALAVARTQRMNQTAAIGQLLAAVEWQCPSNETRQAWHTLTTDQQARVTTALAVVIAEYATEGETR